MTNKTCRRMVFGRAAAIAAVLALPATRTDAACTNMGTALYSGSLGMIDSPFLFPSEPRVVTAPAALAADDVVFLAYQPPATGNQPPRLSLIVLATDCSNWNAGVCSGEGLPTTLCAELPTAPTVSGSEITFMVPGYSGEIGAGGKTKVVPASDASPYRTGPVRVLVSAKGSIPCKYVAPTVPCPTGGNSDNVKACIGSLTANGGVSDNEQVLGVTGLPHFNDFSKLCDKPVGGKHGCKINNGNEKLRFAVDPFGNILIPMQWTEILRKGKGDDSPCPLTQGVCDKRAIRAWTTLKAKSGSNDAIKIPDKSYLQSFNLVGKTFQPGPTFDLDSSTNQNEFDLVGDTDKHFSVLRILRCPDAPKGNQACTTGEYFDVADRMDDGMGPVTVAKEKHCENDHSKSCEDSYMCGGARCLRTGGELTGWVPQPPGPGASSADWAYWLLLLVALGIAWYWWGRNS